MWLRSKPGDGWPITMQAATELADYLPLSFKTPKEQEYIEFLWDAFETNHTRGKYQFAFLAYHMLTMRFVYFNISQIKQTRSADFEKGSIESARDEKALLECHFALRIEG